MKVKLIFRNDVPVTIDAEVEHTADGLVLHVIENQVNKNGVKLGYNYSDSKSKHRRKAIPEETLLEIGKLLKRGLTINKDTNIYYHYDMIVVIILLF